MQHVKKTLSYFLKDPFIWIIIIIACLFWLLLSFYFPITNDLQWPLRTPWIFILPVIIYPILEETVFRGAIMEFFHKKVPGMIIFFLSKSNIITSVIFSMLHFFYHPPLWAAAVFIPSLVFGILKERYQSLVPPILIHIFFNAGYYWLFYK
jgi:membrane protease YdiL (CAAX protease family)